MCICVYGIFQLVMSSLDFFLRGYTQGAADNASGVGSAMAVAQKLYNEPLPANWAVELVITGAEEAMMKVVTSNFQFLLVLQGGLDYFRTLSKDKKAPTIFLINFDSLGAGSVVIAARTGSLSTIRYDRPWNAVFTAAQVAM